MYSKINIEINNLKFSSETKRHLNKNYNIIIRLYIFSIIPLLKVNITKTKMEKLKLKEKIDKIDFKAIRDKNQIDEKALEALKELNIDIQNIKLKIDLGTENASLTSIIIPIISTIIGIILSRKIKKIENQSFIIKPVYINENLINIDFSGIFELKMRHIINIIYMLNKKEGVKEYERTSNRGSYDYSYE